MEKQKMDKRKKIIIASSIAGVAVVATAVTVPLVLLLGDNETPTQPPITGRYYSLHGDNNRFDTIDQAKAYLNTLVTKPQVYTYKGVDYNTLQEMQIAVDQVRQTALGTQMFDPKIYANKPGVTIAPNDGTDLTDYSEATSNTGNIGYLFDGKLYTTLVIAQDAWLASLPKDENNKSYKIAPVAHVDGSATVNVTNSAYPGFFNIDLKDENDKEINEVIRKLTWDKNAADFVIPANQSLYTISFADAGTTAYFIDPLNSNNHLQSYSFLGDYSASPISEAEITINQLSGYTPAQVATPLTTTVFIQQDGFPGYNYEFTKNTKFLTSTFPYMDGSTFNRGTTSRADIATWWDDMIRTLGVTAVIAEPDRDWVSIYKGAETYDVDMSNLPSGVTLPVGWKSVDFMENLNDTSVSKQSKEAVVYAMVYQGMVRLESQASNVNSPAIPATYEMLIQHGGTPTITLDLVGPADGAELSTSQFTKTVFGGSPEETYAQYTLKYDGTATNIQVLGNMIVNGQTPDAPAKPTANDLTIQVHSDYVAQVTGVEYTRADAPAIPSETYVEPITDGVPASTKTPFNGTFHGYKFDNKFYGTLFAAQQAFMDKYYSDNPDDKPVYVPHDSDSEVIVNGTRYSSLQAAQDALIYFVDWIGTPNTLSSHSRRLDDMYELI